MIDTVVLREAGVRFVTGNPVRFPFIRNTEPAPRLRRGAEDRFQQRIEPAGMYLLHDTSRTQLPRGWRSGVASFRSPLVIPWSTSDRYDEGSWKAALVREYRARGARLTDKLLRAGFDGIVTVRDGATSEIVALDPRVQVVFD